MVRGVPCQEPKVVTRCVKGGEREQRPGGCRFVPTRPPSGAGRGRRPHAARGGARARARGLRRVPRAGRGQHGAREPAPTGAPLVERRARPPRGARPRGGAHGHGRSLRRRAGAPGTLRPRRGRADHVARASFALELPITAPAGRARTARGGARAALLSFALDSVHVEVALRARSARRARPREPSAPGSAIRRARSSS